MTSFSVDVDNSGNPGPNGADLFRNAAQTAANVWAGYLQGFGDIQIKISFADLPGDAAARGGSASSQYLGTRNGIDLLQQGSSYEIQTGRDPNGGDPDLLITIDTGYAASVRAGSASLVPILMHEIGHGIAFSGFRNQDGSLPSQTYPDGSHHPYELVYDQMVQSSGGSLTFVGQNAERVNGGPVALANVAHLDASNDLMYPVVSGASQPSALDLAVLQDIGLPVATERDDTIALLSADDHLSAYGGNDTVQAGAGSDLIYGNRGQDLIYGNQDADRLYGGQDNDRVYGGQGTDVVYGNMGADLVYGNLGEDMLYGGQGDDRLYGGQGNDTLVGGLGNDTLAGGLGADLFRFGPDSGADIILGYNQGEGDRLDFGGQSVTTSDDGQGGTLYTIAGGASVDVQGLNPHASA